MSTNLSDLKGRDVLDLATAKAVGTVASVVIDASTGRISALTVSGSGDADVLRWDKIKAIGPDAVTIEDASALTAAQGASEEAGSRGDTDPIGRRVLTVDGDELPKVDDLAIDTDAGSVVGLQVGDQVLGGMRLRAIGDYAVIVTA